MMSRHSTDTNLSEHEIGVLQRREQHGWFVNRIAGDALGPGFAYSFGLYEEFGHPEIIIFGLAEETMHRLINDVGKQVRSGVKYSVGDQTSDLLQGYTCAFGMVNPLQYRETCTWTVWFYEGDRFPALQLFWPDRQNRFPWEPDFWGNGGATGDSLICGVFRRQKSENWTFSSFAIELLFFERHLSVGGHDSTVG
jgi:hypothetical protein